ncbi:MAG: 30S ribosome-binding factor RbfA [Lachnospiraceae bacterium]|nr:30S ribosome-binding factor RbfA [Lachnospiraceae bacterium]
MNNRKSIKGTRVNGEVRKEMSRILREELKDPRIPEMTSVTDVEVTGDLKYAKIYVSVLGNDAEKQGAMEGLRSAASFIRSQIAKNVNLRNTPELTFVLDESIEYGAKMSKKIAELHIDRQEDDTETDMQQPK